MKFAAVTLLLTLALTTASVAAASEPGVHVDPGSPAGKEYQIPVSSTRSELARRRRRRLR